MTALLLAIATGLLFVGAMALIIHDFNKPFATLEPTKAPHKGDFAAAVLAQVRAAKARADMVRTDIMPLDIWLDIAARHIIKMWTFSTYDEARKWMVDELEMAEIVYPDQGCDWSRSSAIEFAETYMQEYGEAYGANE